MDSLVNGLKQKMADHNRVEIFVLLLSVILSRSYEIKISSKKLIKLETRK